MIISYGKAANQQEDVYHKDDHHHSSIVLEGDCTKVMCLRYSLENDIGQCEKQNFEQFFTSGKDAQTDTQQDN